MSSFQLKPLGFVIATGLHPLLSEFGFASSESAFGGPNRLRPIRNNWSHHDNHGVYYIWRLYFGILYTSDSTAVRRFVDILLNFLLKLIYI